VSTLARQWPPLVLSGSRNWSPRGDFDVVALNSPDLAAAFSRLFEDVLGGTNKSERSAMSNEEVIIGSSNLSDGFGSSAPESICSTR
jgi:hypothetical protein